MESIREVASEHLLENKDEEEEEEEDDDDDEEKDEENKVEKQMVELMEILPVTIRYNPSFPAFSGVEYFPHCVCSTISSCPRLHRLQVQDRYFSLNYSLQVRSNL